MDQLFKLVFGNIVLFREIFDHVRLYAYNECVYFSQLVDLQQDHLREYIGEINYLGKELLSKGDLPNNGVLKTVVLSQDNVCTLTPGDAIPFGVEKLKFNPNFQNSSTIPLSTLPSSIHTVENVIICNDTIGYNNTTVNNEIYKIPSNIKSISFLSKSIISYGSSTKVNQIIEIPSTIKTLKFNTFWNNGNNFLRLGDIPEGIISLSMMGYLMKIPCGVLPHSIRELHLTCLDKTISTKKDKYEYSEGYFNFLPPNLETLNIVCESMITPTSGLQVLKIIKNLTIIFNEDKDKSKILPFSLPLSTITSLTIKYIHGKIEIGVIPSSVINLSISFHDLHYLESYSSSFFSIGSIPNNVKSLKLNKHIDNPDILPPLTEFQYL